MKEEFSGEITHGEFRLLSRGTMEHVLDVRPSNDIGAESRNNLYEEQYLREPDIRTSPRSPIRTVGLQGADSDPMSDRNGEVSVAGDPGQPTSRISTSEDHAQQTMQKWALDNAPPPIKVRREGEASEESSPPDLSPPPSPKRMRELSRKDPIHDLAFSKVFSQDSI